jgi:hypothetical protein
MNNQKVLATFVVAVLAASLLSVIGLNAVPLQKASAQAVTIETSADELGGTFFGGMVQVIVEDPAADDDSADTLTIEVDLSSTDGDTSQTITIPDTNAGSQRFEFFIVHQNSTDTAPADPETTAGLTDDQILLFGPTAGADELQVAGLLLYDDATFDVRKGNVEVTIDYEEAGALIELDRETYGSTSLVYLNIVDQDGNLDPTTSDLFTVLDADLDVLFSLNGAAFADDVTFDETGDNTAKFEAILQLTTNDTATDDELDFTSDAIQVTLNDMANYADAGFNNAENDSTDTDDDSFDIDDVDGDLTGPEALTFGSELKVTVDDNDGNVDSEDDDTTTDGLVVTSDGPGGDVVTVDLTETDDNTHLFVPDTTNDEIKITFVANATGIVAGNSILELSPDDITEDIIVAYSDALNDDSVPELFETTLEITLATPQLTLPENAGINDDFLLTITDADFNDNPRTKDSYTFTLDGAGEYGLFRGSTDLSNLATLEVDIEGDPVDFTTPLSYTLVETDINTGVFTTELDMADILDSAEVGGDPVDVDDGDRIEITFNDFMDDVSREASDELAIGKASTALDFSRTVIPIPPEAGSQWVGAGIDTTVFVTLIVTDADQNIQSSTEDNFRFAFEGDSADPDIVSPVFFTVEVETGTGDDLAIDTFAEYTGSVLEDILPGLADNPATNVTEGILLSETGKSTGVFDDTLEFEEGGIGTDEWQDLEITFNYIDADGDEESAGITARGNDGTVTVDQDAVKSGDVLTLTVQDEDLNLDDDTVEEFESSLATNVDFILAVETEDDEIGGISTETLRETGADTGIFTATWTTGTDIPVTSSTGDEIEQATNILITFNDEVDSTGGSGDELEINVPVVTGTGAIQVQPELVGPGTEVTVLVTDLDLDEDPKSTENYDPDDPDSDDFFVSFRSDRDEVGDASPEIEETGPNTGVFEFQLELITDEGGCEDDDLGDAKFEAEGGSEPSIGACPGDLIAVRYEDEQDASGRSTTVSAIIEVKSFDPEFSTDKDSYAVGERITATIADADANRDPDIADSLTNIRITSDSDRVGEEISALETGKNTGVFKLSFSTTSGTAGGAITVKAGDTVAIEYTDDYPADFEEEENDKEFTFTVPVGISIGTGATTMSEPAPVDPATGSELTTVTVGRQIVLSTTIINNFDSAQPFVAMMEVRDSNGITQRVDFQTGTLEPSGQTGIGVSWTPSAPGDYTVRTFAISNLQNPQIISELKESVVTVT